MEIDTQTMAIQRLESDSPRERMWQYGSSVLSNQELLAILLKTGTKTCSVFELSRELLREFGGLKGLQEASLTELVALDGIGPVKAMEIQAALQLGKRVVLETIKTPIKITSSEYIGKVMCMEMSELQQEHLVLILLNSKNNILRKETIFIGTLNKSVAHPREIFRAAIKAAACCFIIVHNHPSGDPTPSPNDISFTERLYEASLLIGIELMDHIIVGNERYVSFREEGYLEQ